MPVVLVLLIGGVAAGLGGYAPWATLLLECGGFAFILWLTLDILLRTSPEQRERNLALKRSRKSRSILTRLKTLLPGAKPVPLADVEIWQPGEERGSEERGRPPADAFFIGGYAFRRHGFALPLLLLTGWMSLSLLPLGARWLSRLSPRAFELKTEVASLLGTELADTSWSLTPFLSLQDILLWLAFVMLFLFTHHLAESPTKLQRLSLCLFLLGGLSGSYGLIQWLTELKATLGDDLLQVGLRATGSFGNRNHYAAFQAMLLPIGLGWWTARSGGLYRRRSDRIKRQEASARAAVLGFCVSLTAVGLLFSVSRAGVTAAAIGCALFFILTRETRPARDGVSVAHPGDSDLRSHHQSDRRQLILALATLSLALIFWIGIDPVVSRFELIPDELAAERGRVQVWRDTLPAVSDFWLTGSGLSSFQHVYPMYRSFGGLRFYSWAHNDYLQLTLELGIPGLAMALWLLVAVFRRAVRVQGELIAHPSTRRLHAGYCAAATAIGFHSVTDFGLHLPANAALAAVILGVVTGTADRRVPRSRSRRRSSGVTRPRPSSDGAKAP